MKAEVVGFKEDGQWSHTFTNQESTMRLTLGVNTVDGWGDMVTAGIAMVRKYIESLATDAKTKTLVQTVLRLLSTDKQGNLNASRVLQLQKLADESDDDQFKEGVKIIRESYQPTATRRYIRAQYRDKGTGAWRNIPLGITDVDLLTEEEKPRKRPQRRTRPRLKTKLRQRATELLTASAEPDVKGQCKVSKNR